MVWTVYNCPYKQPLILKPPGRNIMEITLSSGKTVEVTVKEFVPRIFTKEEYDALIQKAGA